MADRKTPELGLVLAIKWACVELDGNTYSGETGLDDYAHDLAQELEERIPQLRQMSEALESLQQPCVNCGASQTEGLRVREEPR